MTTTRTGAARGYSKLRMMLESRRHELAGEMHSKIRDMRARSAAERNGSGEHDSSESDPQADIDLALIQMKSETLSRIDAALRRLDQGTYGNCVGCRGRISNERLRALPFAVRCTGCEKAREMSERRRRLPDPRWGSDSLSFLSD